MSDKTNICIDDKLQNLEGIIIQTKDNNAKIYKLKHTKQIKEPHSVTPLKTGRLSAGIQGRKGV